MVRKGVIEQQIEEMARMLGALVGLKTQGDDAAVREAMQNGFKSATGLDLAAALALSEETLLTLLIGDPAQPDVGKCAAAGLLLAEQADQFIARLHGLRPPAIVAVERKALALLNVALQEENKMPSVAGELRERRTVLALRLGVDAV